MHVMIEKRNTQIKCIWHVLVKRDIWALVSTCVSNNQIDLMLTCRLIKSFKWNIKTCLLYKKYWDACHMDRIFCLLFNFCMVSLSWLIGNDNYLLVQKLLVDFLGVFVSAMALRKSLCKVLQSYRGREINNLNSAAVINICSSRLISKASVNMAGKYVILIRFKKWKSWLWDWQNLMFLSKFVA